jgi:hypothetical protein
MMIERIKTHNVLNGMRFSIAEFLFIALVILPFAIYYLAYAHWINGLVSVGIISNCLTVVMIGLRQLDVHAARRPFRRPRGTPAPGRRDPRVLSSVTMNHSKFDSFLARHRLISSCRYQGS